jgi:hypothetical protein
MIRANPGPEHCTKYLKKTEEESMYTEKEKRDGKKEKRRKI